MKQRGLVDRAIVAIVALTFSGLMFASTGWAQPDGQRANGEVTGTPSGAALQAASWLATVPYGAVKVGFAIAGGVVGGLAYAFSGGNLESAKSVWRTAMYGTYVLTPDHLKGQKPIRFLGVPDRESETVEPPPIREGENPN